MTVTGPQSTPLQNSLYTLSPTLKSFTLCTATRLLYSIRHPSPSSRYSPSSATPTHPTPFLLFFRILQLSLAEHPHIVESCYHPRVHRGVDTVRFQPQEHYFGLTASCSIRPLGWKTLDISTTHGLEKHAPIVDVRFDRMFRADLT